MSKFDYDIFYGGVDDLGVSKEKYTKEEAIKIAMVELEQHNTNGLFLAISDAFACHRAGVNEDNEPCVGWWLEYQERKRSCPVYAFHVATKERMEREQTMLCYKGTEYIPWEAASSQGILDRQEDSK